MKEGRVVQSDFRILHYLWHWKVMSTAGISNFIYGKPNIQNAYCRLRCLEQNKLVRSVTAAFKNKSVWVLTRRGFEKIKEDLPALKHAGYGSESVEHDFLCSVFQVGPWMHCPPKAVEVGTEQLLRHGDPEAFPKWVPQDLSHRCDGLWRVPNDNKHCTFALEVELSSQRRSRYHDIALYYEANTMIDRVIWLVRNDKAANRIHKYIREGIGENVKYHDFITYGEFAKDGWNAKFKLGQEQGKGMAYLFRFVDYPVSGMGYPLNILNIAKKPSKPQNYKPFELGDFRV